MLRVLSTNTAFKEVGWRRLTQEEDTPSGAQIIKQISQYQVWDTFLKLARVTPKMLLLQVAWQNLKISPCCCRYHICWSQDMEKPS